MSGDQSVILSEGYWPSYNIPFYEEVGSMFVELSTVHFQKLSIPTPWKVSGNSKGVGGLKSPNLK